VNIFLSCLQSTQDHPVPAYQFWEAYFKNGIEEAEHNWCDAGGVDWAEGARYTDERDLEAWRARTWGAAVASLKTLHQRRPIDLFLSYLFPKQVDVNAVREIQRLGIPCANFFCDNVREFVSVPESFRVFDLHWVPEFKAVGMYRSAGLNFVHAPMPMWAAPEHRVWNHPENYGVTFIGSRDVLRENLLAQVLKKEVGLEIRGTGWEKDAVTTTQAAPARKGMTAKISNQAAFIKEHGVRAYGRKIGAKFQPKSQPEKALFNDALRRKPSASEYIEITQQSVITLGINRYPSFRHPLSAPDTYSRLRDLEAPMLGACYLTEWTEGLDQLYDLGEEIETYRTADEMAWKIQALKSDPEKRLKLRRSGQRRALAEHTIPRTLSKIAAAL
jgi:hypothetical protein